MSLPSRFCETKFWVKRLRPILILRNARIFDHADLVILTFDSCDGSDKIDYLKTYLRQREVKNVTHEAMEKMHKSLESMPAEGKS